MVHFAGCWTQNRCQELWDEYWGMRVTVEDVLNPPSLNGTNVTEISTAMTNMSRKA